jgi:ketosteroid isomerase-like protein
MSQENVEMVRRAYEAVNAQGFEGTRHLRHPAIELHDPPDFPDADRYVGEAAFRERVESYMDIGWDGQFRIQECLDAEEEVVVIWQMRGRSTHGGGAPLDHTLAHVCLLEGGKLRRIRQYMTRAEALEAAGILD